MCHDSTVNYFNPYILVFCQHNHDLKCILSGKAAKASSFYITDYITKMGPKTYEMLSLLSKAASNMPELKDHSATANAKILLYGVIYGPICSGQPIGPNRILNIQYRKG